MSTSVIDYIFRELAISYLGRTDLAHVKPEDLRHDTVGVAASENVSVEAEEEEMFEGDVVDDAAGARDLRPDSTHLHLGETTSAPTARKSGGAKDQPGGTAVVAAAPMAPRVSTSRLTQLSKAREARLKGYVGEACANCGAWTLTRNGTCLKCETCGHTTGCS
jgi:ribonucleoside-diphosphate reductase alpha chain